MLEMRKLAGDQGWKLELVELPNGVRELRGYIDEEDDEKKPAEVDAQAKEKQDKKDEEGSEEKFFKKKDEL
ncbi:hypothetical protein PC129_g25084 [Phytophthora cactorum]|nr:hypothetical protein PC129_g25084 [Phytophthora cactorum]